MTNEEICREYRQAKDSRHQIQILAELNQCEKEEIIRILRESGVIEEKLRADSVICRGYLSAKNRTYYIQKTARENHCSVEEIRQILISNGVLVPKPPKKAETAVPEVPAQNQESEAVPPDWKASLKTVTERIVELKLIRDNAEKELSEIYQTLGTLCGKS